MKTKTTTDIDTTKLKPIHDPVGVTYIIGDVTFPGYDKLMKEAQDVAENVRQVVVTEDTIKDAKKVLARTNNAVKELNAKRIDIKKQMMAPYEVFAEKVKAIEAVIDEANAVVKSKVQELEDAERDKKESELYDIWQDMTVSLSYKEYIHFNDFLTPQHLNKTVSIKAVTEEMAEYLAKIQKDADYMATLDDPGYLAEYFKTLDLTDALQTVAERKRVEAQLKEDAAKSDEITMTDEPIQEPTAYFTITGRERILLVEQLLQNNNIEYIKTDK